MGIKKWYPNQHDYDARDFCIRNNIKIWRVTVSNNKYYIGLEINGKETRDPEYYSDDESLRKYYEYCRYYYDKYKDKIK